jgi:hypothetical protein
LDCKPDIDVKETKMAKPSNTTKPSFDKSELENAKVGYQAAVNLITGVISVIWSIFNAMLVANSIVVAGISLVLGNQTANHNYKISCIIEIC